ncbi:hypothetical protein GLAREA_07974 [Glarea lozoyensis ATCC 20868]|uniref:Uncharacterized protein n=1 Tax=Glarea lozoyensis (strain ATCC 20868 / MF5171) TaxID=1116229 RepID=S3CFU5_GLAL2|nr:uncharacterized protein GLAREA_07974 [Glarea lozoyensis ATCC 20868]EPE24124.1 hypothetical protein GLAREA_07974 [Glarea lozoyensis ATCC 20868]
MTFDGLAIYLHQTFKSKYPPTTEEHLEFLKKEEEAEHDKQMMDAAEPLLQMFPQFLALEGDGDRIVDPMGGELPLRPVVGVYPATYIEAACTKSEEATLTYAWEDAKGHKIPGFDCDNDAKAGSYSRRVSTGITIQQTAFCLGFFLEERIGQKFAFLRDSEGRLNMDNYQDNTARTIIHEAYKYDFIGLPQAIDGAYGAEDVYKLARVAGTELEFVNSDSYTIDALSIYLHQILQSDRPPYRLT